MQARKMGLTIAALVVLGWGGRVDAYLGFEADTCLDLLLSETEEGGCPEINITGTPGNDNLVGTSKKDSINGDGGNDTVDGKPGADCVATGDGSDSQFGNKGADLLCDDGGTNDGIGNTMHGGDQGDLILTNFNENASSSNDNIFGDDGADYIVDFDGDDFISGGDGQDSIYSLGRGPIVGDSCYPSDCGGNDHIHGDQGADFIYDCGGYNDISGGGDGDTIVVYGTGSNLVNGDSGIDYIYVWASGFNEIFGGESADYIQTGIGADTVHGQSGGDTIVEFTDYCGWTPPNAFFGEEGNDCIINPSGTTDGGPGFDRCCGGATTTNCESDDCSDCEIVD